MLDRYKAARAVSAPFIAVETADPAAACRELARQHPEYAQIRHDMIQGFTGLNQPGTAVIGQITDGKPPSNYGNPPLAFEKFGRAPGDSTLHVMNAHRLWEDKGFVQSLSNLRDLCKANGAAVVMYCQSARSLPPELRDDCVILTEPAPDAPAVSEIIRTTYANAQLPAPDEATVTAATDALLGLARFSAEQYAALSLKRDADGQLLRDGTGGVDIPALWQGKADQIGSIPGVTFSLPKITYADLVGAENAKRFLGAACKGKRRPRLILWLDELEKMLAGSSGDTSGVSQALNEQFLSWTERTKAPGLILYGVPGAGKSLTCQATAGEAGIPLLQASMSQLKGSLVGQSEQNMAAMLRAIDAMAQGDLLMVATANYLDGITSEIMSRFRWGVWFYDLPNREERAALWTYYRNRYAITEEAPDLNHWTGREIEAACSIADSLQIPLADAVRYIVPVATSRAEVIQGMREAAAGRYTSANYAGTYTLETASERQARQIR